MITIFTIPYSFQGIHKVRQANAIQAWQRVVKPAPEIILFCNDAGVKEAAAQFGCRHVPEISRNKWNTPLVSEAFMKAQEIAKYDIMAWLNADILVNEAWAKAILTCAKKFQRFLAVGQRWDTPSIVEPLNFGGPWWSHVLLHVKQSGKLHSPGGIDNFAFRRGLYKEMPPFAVGKSSWDNWLVADPMNKRYPIINITPACIIVHQGQEKGKVVTAERKANRKLAGQKLATIKNASWVLGANFKITLPVKTKARAKGWTPHERKVKPPSSVKPKSGKTGKITVITVRPLVVQWDFKNPTGATLKPKTGHVGYEIRLSSGKVIHSRRTVTNMPRLIKPGGGFSVKMTPPTDWPIGEYEIWFDFLSGRKWGEKMGFSPLKMLMHIDKNGHLSVRL